ncbi:MAG: 16S rRNA (guanine(527)-N(7))-methyltransferase RsmG [Candidatus Dadabacteria bacterium]|nr:16S rRNA (guanine(527)-N(7))-methyltransferase RsmG [Candidatus Dadabacteria bacterium]MYA47744.1 16S rRNA (guanine(527)-N(7))-methyltransferase RsmG [Candidatus Dadabacteria bacterium]MYF47386.1 16S rRNA (guanine(527)-N(7))-methyltransferase RsmG [Candidatus Dadabacteria bacterium]MYG83223.1 16S rRNA (guanine(527)-N(7))-methyltransferase RsmG [Candidatus Dadabacteria bacterium]MYK50088.1 16S rRNA (guanine(527)-N(7))-methyltransferase RsmG [Candidatus Dadabacteria bacterium]
MTNEQLLREGARRIGVKNLRADFFLSYIDLLRKWGKRINLSSVLSDREIIIKHLLDSLTVAEFIPSGSRVLDIGTGAGLPGIPLYIYDASLSVTLVESVGKKVAFLKEVKRSLGLSGVDIHNARAEEPGEGMRGRFDRVTSRAVGSVNTVVALGTPYLDIGGEMVIMKGPRGKKEWEDYASRHPDDMELLLTKELKLPFSGENRVIILAKPMHRQMETEV